MQGCVVIFVGHLWHFMACMSQEQLSGPLLRARFRPISDRVRTLEASFACVAARVHRQAVRSAVSADHGPVLGGGGLSFTRA